MNGKEIKTALKKGEHVFGTAVLSPSPVWPDVVAAIGLDFVFIDTEHTPLNRETVSYMCHMYRTINLAPIVRIPSPDPFEACMAIDAGASGIIAPYIETVDQVKGLTGAVKFKPLKGEKLYNLDNKNHSIEQKTLLYLEKRNEENILIVNIESLPAMDNLDNILSVKGVDAILIGPHDLSCSLGIPEDYENPLFKNSVINIIEKARSKGIGAGIHMFYDSGFQQEIQWARQGANLIVHSSDLLAFKYTLRKEILNLKRSLDIKAETHSGEDSII